MAPPVVSAGRNALLPLVIWLSLLTAPFATAAGAEDALGFKEHLERANQLIKSYRHFEACEALQEATKLAGNKHPSLHMRLAILYYGLGLVPEAISEGEKAVSLSPASKWYKYDLAKFYYVNKQLGKAEQQLVALLTQDPGFTLGYYYLAELYFRNKNYDMAWLSLQRAKLLGHRAKQLEQKLARLSNKPSEDFSALSLEPMLFRFIKVAAPQDAEEILAGLGQGKLFENFELEGKKEPSGESEFGVLDIREAQPPLAEALRRYQLFAPPEVVQTASEYRIVQRIAPFRPELWRALVASPRGRAKEPGLQAPARIAASGTTTSTGPTTGLAPAATASSEPRRSAEQEQLALQLEAYYTLESWKNAWQAGDPEGYLANYSERFTPSDNTPLAAWKDKRRISLTKPRYIRLRVENPVVELQPENRLEITFVQRYASDSYSDSVRKALLMVREKGRWRISEERTLEVLEQ